MRKLVIGGLFALLFAVPTIPAATAAPTPQSKALLRVASKLSGLKVQRAVRVVVEKPARFRMRRVATLDTLLPRSTQAHDEAVYRALGLTAERNVLRSALVSKATRAAVYDPRTRRIHVQRKSTPRAALLKELVHALQDQHFDLRRMRKLGSSRDAALAATAAVEGHATLVAGVLGARSLSSHGGPRLNAFLDLQRGFMSTVGRRFAVDLRNLGGNKAVFGSLRRFPDTTEQVFHLDKFLERERPLPVILPVDAGGLKLVSDNTFGELDVRALLAVFAVPRLDHAASGWGGGRSAVYRAGGREAVAVALDWDTELDAQQWADAVTLYVNEAFDPETVGPPPATPCAATTCWSVGGRGVAFVREGARTALVVGAEVDEAAGVARTIVPAR